MDKKSMPKKKTHCHAENKVDHHESHDAQHASLFVVSSCVSPLWTYRLSFCIWPPSLSAIASVACFFWRMRDGKAREEKTVKYVGISWASTLKFPQLSLTCLFVGLAPSGQWRLPLFFSPALVYPFCWRSHLCHLFSFAPSLLSHCSLGLGDCHCSLFWLTRISRFLSWALSLEQVRS